MGFSYKILKWPRQVFFLRIDPQSFRQKFIIYAQEPIPKCQKRSVIFFIYRPGLPMFTFMLIFMASIMHTYLVKIQIPKKSQGTQRSYSMLKLLLCVNPIRKKFYFLAQSPIKGCAKKQNSQNLVVGQFSPRPGVHLVSPLGN